VSIGLPHMANDAGDIRIELKDYSVRRFLTLNFDPDLSIFNSEIWHGCWTSAPNFMIIRNQQTCQYHFSRNCNERNKRTNEPTNWRDHNTFWWRQLTETCIGGSLNKFALYFKMHTEIVIFPTWHSSLPGYLCLRVFLCFSALSFSLNSQLFCVRLSHFIIKFDWFEVGWVCPYLQFGAFNAAFMYRNGTKSSDLCEQSFGCVLEWVMSLACALFTARCYAERVMRGKSSDRNVQALWSLVKLHRRRSSVNFGGHDIFAWKIWMKKKYQNARILHDSCPKKLSKYPNFYLYFLHFWGGGRARRCRWGAPCPRLLRLWSNGVGILRK